MRSRVRTSPGPPTLGRIGKGTKADIIKNAKPITLIERGVEYWSNRLVRSGILRLVEGTAPKGTSKTTLKPKEKVAAKPKNGTGPKTEPKK
jgi:hypothetical protein